ncbi:hypothetical protein AB1Y20_015121 [Prymnesium parvum]|uniref:Set2 Rpb1 interacting domain-containing protein n=1 Tax=Prymnesium parvum TaxID=97485 RepID=A0AB34JVU4_PRYPA
MDPFESALREAEVLLQGQPAPRLSPVQTQALVEDSDITKASEEPVAASASFAPSDKAIQTPRSEFDGTAKPIVGPADGLQPAKSSVDRPLKTAKRGRVDTQGAASFKDAVAAHVKRTLKSYLKAGRISSKEDFKLLARETTHKILEKEGSGRKQWDGTTSRKIEKYIENIFIRNFVYVRPNSAVATGSTTTGPRKIMRNIRARGVQEDSAKDAAFMVSYTGTH